MRNLLKTFLRDEDGAVTVDWVVLTAGVGFIGVVVVGSILQASTDQANGIAAYALQVGTDALQQPTP
ncbi:MAG: hypothetical protein AAGA87_14970 [Pseudomonadota bacterium]